MSKNKKINLLRKIEKLAFNNVVNNLSANSAESLTRYLIAWWCNYYRRPKRDPLLLEYTLEELLLEFFEQKMMDNSEYLNVLKKEYIGTENELTDEEWIKLQEKEVGKISPATNEKIEEVEKIEDDFTNLGE